MLQVLQLVLSYSHLVTTLHTQTYLFVSFKGIAHPKWKILLTFIHPHLVSILYDFLLLNPNEVIFKHQVTYYLLPLSKTVCS